jgi:Ca-activated chloride channel family protein
MFRFEHPEHLWALLLIFLFFLLFGWMWRSRSLALRQLGRQQTLERLMPHFSQARVRLKFALWIIAYILLIIAWANPQWGAKREKAVRKASDIFIAIDISQSMLTEDLAPNRLEQAKRFGETLVDALAGDRIGLIVFAANAYLQMPLTTDYGAAKVFMRSVHTGLAPYQGTSLGQAVDMAERFFDPENKANKALVLLTDGENHDPDALNRIREARDNGLVVYPIAVGTQEGGMVPEFIRGNKQYKKDAEGNPIRSQVSYELLSELAEAGGGRVFTLDDPNGTIEGLKRSLEQLEKQELEQRQFDQYESYYQYFLAGAILLLLIRFLLSEKSSGWMRQQDLFADRN